ncbi:hypothetical protein LCGC14_0625920 [marine sediment metagenome]|uniref:Uncharacterized protein n=1 Tax=marine sediment metagenome TaxID=412755 RepID=A0A0F9UBX2_9ZZZZ
MKPKTRFLKMYFKLPEKARRELVYDFANHPMSLNVCSLEIRDDTPSGKKILKELGYE